MSSSDFAPIPEAPTLSQLIQSQRKRLKMSQVDLARAAGVSESSIRNWEARGEIPSARSLPGLADALGLEVVQLAAAANASRRALQSYDTVVLGGSAAAWETPSSPVPLQGKIPTTFRVSLGVGDITVTIPTFEATTWDGLPADAKQAARSISEVLGAIEAAAAANDWRCSMRGSNFSGGDNDIPF